MENNIEKKCVGRESNPGQLLGRQLCSPLYHRRLVVVLTAMWQSLQDQLIALAFFLSFVLIMIRVIKLRVLS